MGATDIYGVPIDDWACMSFESRCRIMTDEIERLRADNIRIAERNNRYWQLISDAEDIAEDAGRPEGELVTESMSALVKERDEAREAARWWMRRDQLSHDPSVVTDQLQLWPWLDEKDGG